MLFVALAIASAATLFAFLPPGTRAHAQALTSGIPGRTASPSPTGDVSGAIDPVPVKATGPVTVVTQFRFPDDDDSLRRVWLAALAMDVADATRTTRHLALVWEKQAGRFGRWELKLTSDTGLVAGAGEQRLAVAFPDPETTYIAALGYDPAGGVVSIRVTADDATPVHKGELRVTPGPEPSPGLADLIAWTGIECDPTDRPAPGSARSAAPGAMPGAASGSVPGTASSPVSVPDGPNPSEAASDDCQAAVSSPALILVIQRYVPVGAEARLVRPGRGGQSLGRRVDRRLDWAVGLDALRLPRDGTLRLVARTAGEPGKAILLDEVPAGALSPEFEIPFDASILPAGKADLVVEYVVEHIEPVELTLGYEGNEKINAIPQLKELPAASRTWELASLPVDVGVVSAHIAPDSLIVDTAHGRITGSLVLEADGPVDGFVVSLGGEMLFDEPTDDPLVTAIQHVASGPIVLTAPHTFEGRTERIPFTVPLPSTQIAGRLDLRLRVAAELPDGVSAQLDSDFRHVHLVPGVPSLAELFGPYFAIGFATDTIPREAEALLERHFNVLTTGNSLKWDSVQSRPGVFDFTRPDALLEWASRRGMEMIGHTLVWHQQTPDWVFQGEGGSPATRELLLARMKEHIHTVVGRYCGRIRGWDVVNEALEEDGSLRSSPWRRIIGDDYIEWAFRFAHEACPTAELYYNDYNLTSPAKRQGAIRLIRRLQEQGIPVHGVGEQGHYDIFGPSPAELRATIEDLASLGVKVMITELDMSAYAWADRRNVYTAGFPAELARRQALRYAEFFRIFIEYAGIIDRVTFWGTTDRYSWKNDFPVPRRTDHPLLFDRDGHYKPAFWAVLEVGRAQAEAVKAQPPR